MIGRSVARVFVAAIGIMALSSCNLDVPAPNNGPSDPATETFDSSLGVDISTMQKTPLGDYYKDGPLGSGPVVNGLVTVVISYRAFVKSGALFDTGDHVTINLGNEIQGLQDGLQGMHELGERLIVIPSALGFGTVGSGAVGPNSTLIYDVIVDLVP